MFTSADDKRPGHGVRVPGGLVKIGAGFSEKRWTKKAARWNPALSAGTKACRAVGRPKKRWEDERNQFHKPEETEKTKGE